MAQVPMCWYISISWPIPVLTAQGIPAPSAILLLLLPISIPMHRMLNPKHTPEAAEASLLVFITQLLVP